MTFFMSLINYIINYIIWILREAGMLKMTFSFFLGFRSWAASLLCGNGESGQEYNTSYALFPCLISLTVSTVYTKMNMYLYHVQLKN